MEKITYAPLIRHLEERAGFYNQLYGECERLYGRLDQELLRHWLAAVAEPIVESTAAGNADALPRIFNALFVELLPLLGSNQGVIHQREYQSAWRLCLRMPHLVTLSPTRVLRALSSAVASLLMFQPGKVDQWDALMEQVLPGCRSVDDFLACGRINAWFCGMAHLRERASDAFDRLSPELQETLRENCPVSVRLADAFAGSWGLGSRPVYAGEAGGFVGSGGPFSEPPRVALLGRQVVTADGITACALFADPCGHVLLPDVPVEPQEVSLRASCRDLGAFLTKYGRNAFPFDDVSSCVLAGNTFVLTRHSSHYLYLYGWSR